MHLHPPETVVVPTSASREAEPSLGRRPWNRRLLWSAVTVALVTLLVLTPPLVNANRYRGKIAESMSKSLGRPVHLDNVSLHLLPVPGFTLQNLVVSEDPAFGAEPTIRANTVEATLRVSSLWHRPVEFSRMRFVEPSVNLVRNAQGRWNLSDVLLNASHVQSAPTSQQKAGPKPRFPYIEATGGRVNVKLGAEKLPFSLTDAEFALWLPSPQQWRVRLAGQPARTDSNITDPGRLQIEGELRHATAAAAVPVNFRASWHDAPLGEATRILAGDDWGWRGSLNVDATLTGTLGDAHMASKLTLGGLRRADFFPPHPLDLQVTCESGFTLHPATVMGLRCSLPDDAPEPLRLQADLVRVQGLKDTPVSLKGDAIPIRWAMLWASLFSQRVPTDLPTTGTVDIDLARATAATDRSGQQATSDLQTRGKQYPAHVVQSAGAGWTGTVRLTMPQGAQSPAAESPGANVLTWTAQAPEATGRWPSLHLLPTTVVLGPDATVALAGDLREGGYSWSVDGSAPAAALLQPARYLPQLGDGLETLLPYPPTGTAAARVQFMCTRTWSTEQRCTAGDPVAGSAKAAGVSNGRVRRRR